MYVVDSDDTSTQRGQRQTPQSYDDKPSEDFRVKRKHYLKRLEIPLFDGVDAESWILRVDQYFEIGAFTEEEKLKDIRMCSSGKPCRGIVGSETETNFGVGRR